MGRRNVNPVKVSGVFVHYVSEEFVLVEMKVLNTKTKTYFAGADDDIVPDDGDDLEIIVPAEEDDIKILGTKRPAEENEEAAPAKKRIRADAPASNKDVIEIDEVETID